MQSMNCVEVISICNGSVFLWLYIGLGPCQTQGIPRTFVSVCVKWVGVNGLVSDGISTQYVGLKNARDGTRRGLKGLSLFLSLFKALEEKIGNPVIIIF